MPLIRERVKLLPEARDMMTFFYMPGGVDPDPVQLAGKAFAKDRDRAALLLSEALVAAESVEDWSHERLEEIYRELAARMEAKVGDLFMLMRVALSGRTVSPPLFESLELLGRDRSLDRLRGGLAIADE